MFFYSERRMSSPKQPWYKRKTRGKQKKIEDALRSVVSMMGKDWLYDDNNDDTVLPDYQNV